MKTTVFDLYRSPVNIWVEDDLTHSVLTEIWADLQINVIVACGKPSVCHMVLAAPRRHASRVFGLVDRDFDEDDEERWDLPDRRLLRFPVHEFENLLLDFPLLSELAMGCPADQIRRQAQDRAQELIWWTACKVVLRQVRHDVADDFLSDPPMPPAAREVRDRGSALRHLTDQDFWSSRRRALDNWMPDAVDRRLLAEADRLQADLQSGAWVMTFSGKEILRHLRSHVRGLDRSPERRPAPTQAERDEDLGKRLARLMRERQRVPEALVRIRQVVRQKAGLRGSE
jgi:hypothetical protein